MENRPKRRRNPRLPSEGQARADALRELASKAGTPELRARVLGVAESIEARLQGAEAHGVSPP